jgi:hypothetical protein
MVLTTFESRIDALTLDTFVPVREASDETLKLSQS